ncbi:MAG: shikimate dehydrogenase, partial [Chitinophagales bacterium]|nr:shikimate dehydrogenase [Chitinophagales bacterium]
AEGIGNCSYDLFELPGITDLPVLLKVTPGLAGLNITIPYKEAALNYVDILSPDAAQIGAVNCLKINEGKVEGYNTDAYGFEVSLTKTLTAKPEQAFVLGTGGSSKAVGYVLNKLNIPFYSVSREKKDNGIAYNEIEGLMRGPNLFINTTPLGMFPAVDACPDIPYDKIGGRDVLFDLIYNPAETEFLKRGKAQGAIIKNGLEMLELQAEKSWEIWNS